MSIVIPMQAMEVFPLGSHFLHGPPGNANVNLNLSLPDSGRLRFQVNIHFVSHLGLHHPYASHGGVPSWKCFLLRGVPCVSGGSQDAVATDSLEVALRPFPKRQRPEGDRLLSTTQ
jgi:hypothetical protein